MGSLRKLKRKAKAPAIKAHNKALSKLVNNDVRSEKQIDKEWRFLAAVASKMMTMYELWVLHYKYRFSKAEMIRFEEETKKLAWLLTHSYNENSEVTPVKTISVADLEIMMARPPEDYGASFKASHRVETHHLEADVGDREYTNMLAKKRRNSVQQDFQNFEIISLFVLMEEWGWKKKKLANMQAALQKMEAETDYAGYAEMVKAFQKRLSLDCGLIDENSFNVVRSGCGEIQARLICG